MAEEQLANCLFFLDSAGRQTHEVGIAGICRDIVGEQVGQTAGHSRAEIDAGAVHYLVRCATAELYEETGATRVMVRMTM